MAEDQFSDTGAGPEKAKMRIEFLKTLEFLCQEGKDSQAEIRLFDGSVQTGQLGEVDKNFEQVTVVQF